MRSSEMHRIRSIVSTPIIGICLAGEERMWHISSQIVGENLKGEIATLSFPLSSGGEEHLCVHFSPGCEDCAALR